MKKYVWTGLADSRKATLLQRPPSSRNQLIVGGAAEIIDAVRKRGDEAVAEYAQKFEGQKIENTKVTPKELETYKAALAPEAKKAVDTAYATITAYHAQQGYKTYQTSTTKGVSCHRIVRPIPRVGLYVPGGSAPLVSTALMLGVPSQIAGNPLRVLCTPAGKDGKINPYILYAAELCGITRIHKIGGAQAIAALAFGTKTVAKVDKIFGPGNSYVTEAKRQVARHPEGAALDMPAGPSEIMVIADETTPAAFAAADLLSQAEHDSHSQVMLVCTSESKCDEIIAALEKQLSFLPRASIAQKALDNSSAFIVSNMVEAIETANAYAPEHLILCFEDAEKYLPGIQNAGSIFLGPYTPEAAGDYASGTNHVLPTFGHARTYSGLSVEAFQKTMSVQAISREGLENLGNTIETLAKLEGLDAHARAISIRRKG